MREIILFIIATSVATAAIRIEVKTGDDPQQALQKARLIRLGNPDETIEIVFADGVHTLAAPLLLTTEDSGRVAAPLRLIAADGAKPVLSGGRMIHGFKTDAAGLWTTRIDGAAFEQMWVNDRRAIRAQEPDRGFFLMKAVTEKRAESSVGAKAQQTVTLSDAGLLAMRTIKPDELPRVRMLAYHKWDNTRRVIEQLTDNGFVTSGEAMQGANQWNSKSGIIFENLQSGWDEPGEWFLAADGQLVYRPRPGEDPTTATVVLSRMEKLLVIAGQPDAKVRHVEIRGLAFHHAGWTCPPCGFEPVQSAANLEASIQIDYAQNIVFSGCDIAHTGLHGIWFRDGCHDCRIEKSILHDLGAGGVRIGSTHSNRDTGGNTVEDSIIRDGGLVFPCASAVWIGHSSYNSILHNEISHFAYTGISIGWQWGYNNSEAKRNRIEANHIHHIGDGRLSDLGGIYTLGQSEGTVLRGNRIHDVVSYDYGGWGLYNDEGSSGILLEDNLVYRTTAGGYHQHYGKENIVRNNIFAFARDQQLQFTRPEDHVSFRFTGNIVLWEKGPLWSGNAEGKGNFEIDRNLLWQSDGREIECFGQTLTEWHKAGHDSNSVIADPGFVDPAKCDFRIKDSAAAERIGFRPFDTLKAGVRGSAEWQSKAREALASWPQ